MWLIVTDVDVGRFEMLDKLKHVLSLRGQNLVVLVENVVPGSQRTTVLMMYESILSIIVHQAEYLGCNRGTQVLRLGLIIHLQTRFGLRVKCFKSYSIYLMKSSIICRSRDDRLKRLLEAVLQANPVTL